MSSLKDKKIIGQEKLEHRILRGLLCEWETALWVLSSEHRKYMQMPLFNLKDMNNKLGYWSGEKKEICLSRNFVHNNAWNAVREVLLHEMAHQLAEQVLGAGDEKPHGPKFQKACHFLRANPKASGNYKTLHERISSGRLNSEDKIMLRIKKLMALAESQNHYEAEAAMAKAHKLIAIYNIDLLDHDRKRHFTSVFIGTPALRHPREKYHLAHLILDFYFVKGIWVPAFVVDKGKMGRVLEISGTLQNVNIAIYIHDFILRFIDSKWVEYNQDKGLNRFRKTDFAVGIIEGFRSKLETEIDGKKIFNDKFSLIKIEDPLLKKYISYKYPNTVSFIRNASSQDENILKEGMRVGKKLVIYKGITDKKNSKRLLP
jgi:hypothetical protein